MRNKNIVLWFAFIVSVLCGSCNRNVTVNESLLQSEIQYYTSIGSLADVKDTSHKNKSHSGPMVFCYHQIRDWDVNDSKAARPYIVAVSRFKEQIKFLHDNGYHTILPGQLVNFYQQGEKLPDKPFLLTFDDGTINQYFNALPELEKYGFEATFFIMTVTIGRPGYMASEEIRYLADHGHVIGCHTWDHHNVTKYNDNDWKIQLKKPTELLQKITGKSIEYFAYPYGAWNSSAIEHLKNENYKAAFQLIGKEDGVAPLYSIRRTIVDGNWTIKQFKTRLAL
jgi:peptidoglycan/xylan/chitin deacetylase (PgdA/CDA1 family)